METSFEIFHVPDPSAPKCPYCHGDLYRNLDGGPSGRYHPEVYEYICSYCGRGIQEEDLRPGMRPKAARPPASAYKLRDPYEFRPPKAPGPVKRLQRSNVGVVAGTTAKLVGSALFVLGLLIVSIIFVAGLLVVIESF